jgi:hypothetical protein
MHQFAGAVQKMEVSLMIIKKSRSGYFICLNSLLPVRGGLVALGYYGKQKRKKDH